MDPWLKQALTAKFFNLVALAIQLAIVIGIGTGMFSLAKKYLPAFCRDHPAVCKALVPARLRS